MDTQYASHIAKAVVDLTENINALTDEDCRLALTTLGRLARVDPQSPECISDLVRIVMDLAALL